MKYTDLSINLGFHKNMQETNWLKLFPKWWAENDPLLQAIGKEIAYIKADGIFELLNTGLKPPVMIWQESINHKQYNESFSINKTGNDNTNITELIKLPAPLYKTFGQIKINNNSTDDINNLKIALTEDDYIIIFDTISTNDNVLINVGNQKVYINDKEANISINNDGLSYFKTGQNKSYLTPTIVKEEENEDIIIYQVTVPSDYDGKIYIYNDDYELYDGIFCINNSEDITFDENGISRKFYIANTEGNKKNINVKLYGSSLYFATIYSTATKKNNNVENPKPLHNESINLFFDFGQVTDVNMDIDVTFDNVVFVNEQNIEVHGLELIPIKSVNLYAYYDFPHNPISTGWRKVYEKEYDPKTEVLYDMITTQFYTKKFYVEVFFEGLDYPYQVGFPCDKNKEKDSIYHINEKLDQWGEYLGLKRRNYKTYIPDEDYPYTFPQYYPFNIEQDYWYYQRLINEYSWNDLAINEVDLIDTDDNPLIRLHSINPFVEDFVVYANSTYPTQRENVDYNIFTPNYVNQDIIEAEYKRMPYFDTQNLLRYDNNKANVTLLNKHGTNITGQKYLSKPLRTFFDLSILPKNVDINSITVLVEAESTDNNINKYSNDETGIIIPGIDDTKLFQMRQSSSYEMEEKEIEYTLTTTINDIKKEINRTDSNIIHQVVIKPFDAKQGSYLNIPFILKENDEFINDITDVYVTYDNIKTYQGEYHSDKNGKYIRVWLPITTVNYTTMSISCKCNTNHSFTVSNIKLKTSQQTEEKDDTSYNFTYIHGPIVDDEQQTAYIEDEWHTTDFRDILQKDGIYFINTFENDDKTNTPVILIKNITLKIEYQPKKETFKLLTQIHKKDVQSPSIAQLDVTVKNTGGIPLQTKVDIVHATNIKMQPNTYMNIDLNPNESTTETFDIIPEYPILDGQYDILTICKDKTAHNIITISSNGLIQTRVDLAEHYGKYNENITLNASVSNINNTIIDDGVSNISFYIDNFKVGESIVKNNKATLDVTPSNMKYLNAGFHILEARFSGNMQFASSRTKSSLLISQNNTNIDLIAEDTVIYNKPYNIHADIYSLLDNNKEKITEGYVSFYLNDNKLGTVKVVNGIADLNIDALGYVPKQYTLKALYEGTSSFSRSETQMEILIIGGETKITGFDVTGKPSDDITLKAKITNVMNVPISVGYAIFTIKDNDNIIFTSPHINLNRGITTTTYHIDDDILSNTDLNKKEYIIIINYFDNTNIYQSSEGTAKLLIKKGEVIIDNLNVFFGSQYEPLGFYITVKDAETNMPITDGQVSLSIPELNITTPLYDVENDGGIRIIHNPVTITADEFNQLLHFYFKLGKTMPYKNENNEIIPLLLDSEESITSFNAENLYRIYDGDLSDLNLMDFTLEDNNQGQKILKYHMYDTDSNADEQVFIGEDGHLYARTNLDPLRQYKNGTFPITINYESNAKYKSNTKQSLIHLNQSAIDIDIHSQKITYGDVEKSIICYVTEYNLGTDQTTTLVNEGNVIFFIDDIQIHTSNIVNGLGVMSSNDILDVPYGHHLLMAEYIADNKPTTYTYTDLVIEPIISGINATLNREFKGQKSKLSVEIYIDNKFDVSITGDVEIYLDDVLIASNYLFGIEDLHGNVSLEEYDYNHLSSILLDFIIDMPNDIDVVEHTLTIKYLGDNHILPCTENIILKEKKLPISIDTKDIYVAQNNICHLELDIHGADNGIINDGEISIYQGNNNLQAKASVKNNHATIEWLVTDEPSNIPYLYTIEYDNGSHYESPTEPIEQKVYVIAEQDSVYIAQDVFNDEIPYEYELPIFTTLQEALQCVKNDGNIYVLDSVTIDNHITINKDVHIIGSNNSLIFKDLKNLLSNDIGSIQIYDYVDFEDNIYEIVGLKNEHLNTTDFHIVDNDLFFVRDNKIIPIFLLSDNKFYSYDQLSLSSIISNISLTLNGNVSINNIHFTSLDSDNIGDLIIKNQKNADIQKSIIDKTITINNRGTLKLNTSLIYGNIIGSGQYDLDNNWWGSNDKPSYNINNQIILQLDTNIDPPVIGDDIRISAKLIGTNNMTYDLPPLEYTFKTDSGYFSIEHGVFVENIATTIYLDGTEECTIYCIVDDATISLDILSYDRKTEIILDPAIDIPIGYQIPLRAKVQSIADTFYKFDDNLNVIQKSNDITNGVCDFYIDDIKIGRARVINGQAELPIYFSELQYPKVNDGVDQYTNLNLKVVYLPDEYYFTSIANKDITLIDGNKVCFVSPNGNTGGNGSFDNPYDSIQQAVNSNKARIYLKEGTYKDNEIRIDKTPQDIRQYNGECIFADNGYVVIFRGNNNSTQLTLTGLTFANNGGSIVYNIPNVYINKCIFYKNTYNLILNNNREGETIVRNSVIILSPNKRIFKNYNYTHTMEYCWFGTNNPNTDLNEPDTITKYVIMTFESSKEKIYLGSIAHLTAGLKYYQDNSVKSLLDDTLPLRIAKFYTIYGNIEPIKDYTHNNKAISLLNTNEQSNIDKIILTANDNTNYITQPIRLTCNVTNIYDEPIVSGQVKFKTRYNDEDIILYGDINNGIATVEYSTPFNIGEYQLECSYEQYKNISTFKVIKPQIIMSDFTLIDGDYIYDMFFNLKITDSFNKEHINQEVDIYIDNNFIAREKIIDSVLNTHLQYPILSTGTHTLHITTKELNTDYDIFVFEKDFNVTKKDTYIEFNYTGLAVNEPTDLIIKVYDKDRRIVQTGNIDIKYDNNTVYTNQKFKYSEIETPYHSIPLENGIATLYDFFSNEGQHSFVIHYNGNDIYNESLFINNNFNVGLDQVVIASQELKDQLNVNIGQPFSLDFPITDMHNNPVQHGEVNLFLNNFSAKINEKPLQIKNGYISFNGNLPSETKAMIYDFIITYQDDTNHYLSTTYYDKINVHPIQTQILVDTIYAVPNQTIQVNYNIESEYGPATIGRIRAYYNDALIGEGDVSDINNTISLTIPMLPGDETYNILFEYITDQQSVYTNSQITVPMIIVKDKVYLSVKQSEYYPHKTFDYTIYVKDQNDNDITFGTVKLYIDNVETNIKQVSNGSITIPQMIFDTAKEYKINIIYLENDYYQETSYEAILNIGKLNIQDIYLSDMHSKPNNTLETQIHLDVIDINTYDGFIDFYIDDQKVGAFSIIDKEEQYVKINIPNINAGIHQMKFVYSNSSIFNDGIFIHDFIIDSQTIQLNVPTQYIATLNDTIEFDTIIDKKIDGTIEYSLITIENEVSNSRFIGIEQINKRNTIPFSYTLPNNLSQNDNTQYLISVHFLGNDQYSEQEKQFNLYINKTMPIFDEFNVDTEVEYQAELHSTLKINNLNNNTIIYYYLDSENNNIGHVKSNETDEDGYISFTFDLTNDYKPGTTHSLIAVIKESTTLDKAVISQNFNITKSTPSLSVGRLEANIKTNIQIPTTVIDKGTLIETGTLTFTLDGIEIGTVSPGENLIYTLDVDYEEEKEILVSYTANSNDYNDFEDIIILQLNKNIINFNLTNYNSVTRNKTIEPNIEVTSPTIENIGDISYEIFLENELITTMPEIFIEPSLPDKPTYIIKVKFDGNDIFYPRTQEFTLININEDEIYVNDEITLEQAFDLVADYGTIYIDDFVSNEEVINDKHVTIVGNNMTLSDSSIVNNKELHISNLTLQQASDSAIKNNGEIYIDNCTFNNNSGQYGGAIYIGNKNINTEIKNCVFNGNSANLYGGAIFSNQGNDVIIESCEFTNQNIAFVKGSSISSSGNIKILNNIFFDNDNDNEIYIIKGTAEVENNFFDGKISSIENKDICICNMNYWGYNDLDIIKENNTNINIDTWFISNYTIDYKEPNLGNIHKYITPKINQYRNTLEKEDLLYKDITTKDNKIPIFIDDEIKFLNETINVKDKEVTLKIGQEEFIIGA